MGIEVYGASVDLGDFLGIWKTGNGLNAFMFTLYLTDERSGVVYRILQPKMFPVTQARRRKT
jgi:hypothetical protein